MNFTKLLQNDGTAEWVREIVTQLKPYPYLADFIIILLAFAVGAVLSWVLYFILEHFLERFYRRYCQLSEDLLRCIRNMSSALVTCLPIYMVAYCAWVDGVHEWLAYLTRELMEGALVISLSLALTFGIRSFGLWYKQRCNATQRPIDGLLRVSISFVWAAATILFFAVVLNKNPFYLLSGLGAMAAVLMLVLQPTILSLVASVRVNANHLVEIGDWIVLESDGVDGEVEEISLHTVKVRNWDKALVCLPVCDLVNKSFVNYTAMERTGGRRIKKSLFIDQRSVRFLTKEEVKELKGFDILKDYLNGKEEEISTYNSGRTHFNTRHMTNLGTFCVYVKHYLEHHPSIRNDMTLMAHVREPSRSGIPLEIYCFSKETSWVPFENVQTAILVHLLAVMPNFRLRVFQECSDIYQEAGAEADVVGGAFRVDRYDSPGRQLREKLLNPPSA